jgi:hypothetical protein
MEGFPLSFSPPTIFPSLSLYSFGFVCGIKLKRREE